MRLNDYADWVEDEVTRKTPHQVVRKWAKQWDKSLTALRKPGPYEHVAIIVARWEFLGGLYSGEGFTTTAKHARKWADDFLHPVRPGYAALHNMSGTAAADESEFFGAYRNKPLHGYTLTGIFALPDDVTAWWVSSVPHLSRTARGNLRLSSPVLQRDFIKAVQRFADYLHDNVGGPSPPTTPRQHWRRSFWNRFCPLTFRRADWEADGERAASSRDHQFGRGDWSATSPSAFVVGAKKTSTPVLRFRLTPEGDHPRLRPG